MIELHEFAPAWGINPSPFCLKIEVYLRLAGISYRPVTGNPLRAPKGKLPFIVDEGQRIPDSGQIIAYLQARRGDSLDGGLTAGERSVGHLIRRTCEESLYFAVLYARWIEPSGWDVVRPALFGGMPPVLRDLVPLLARRSVVRSLHGQGYGRHSRDEVFALGIADIDALAAQIELRPFAAAERPTSFDATLYAFLLSITRPPIEMPLKARALSLPSLQAYVERMGTALAGQHTAASLPS